MRTHPPARRRRCRTCHRHTLRGLDEDQCAFTATTDPTPLTPTGEAIALLAGLTTYLHDSAGRLWRRTSYDITDRPADTPHPYFPGEVVADHHCGIDLTAYQAARPPATDPAADPANAACPY